MSTRKNKAMNANKRYVWAIYFVGFDDTTDDAQSRVEPHVGKERIQVSGDPEEAWYEVGLSVLARGGQLLTLAADDEKHAEAIRQANEAEILRRR
jgi:hypothetical protein